MVLVWLPSVKAASEWEFVEVEFVGEGSAFAAVLLVRKVKG
jgi:hypothetical protein